MFDSYHGRHGCICSKYFQVTFLRRSANGSSDAALKAPKVPASGVTTTTGTCNVSNEGSKFETQNSVLGEAMNQNHYYIYIPIYVYTYICIYLYMYIPIYMYTYIYIYKWPATMIDPEIACLYIYISYYIISFLTFSHSLSFCLPSNT